MNLTDHDNVAQGVMPEPSKAQQEEYYRLYAEIEAEWGEGEVAYAPKSRLIHAEVVRRMGLNEVKEMK